MANNPNHVFAYTKDDNHASLFDDFEPECLDPIWQKSRQISISSGLLRLRVNQSIKTHFYSATRRIRIVGFIVSRLVSLGSSFSADHHITDLLQREHSQNLDRNWLVTGKVAFGVQKLRCRKPTQEPNMKWIGWPVAEISPFEIFQDGAEQNRTDGRTGDSI